MTSIPLYCTTTAGTRHRGNPTGAFFLQEQESRLCKPCNIEIDFTPHHLFESWVFPLVLRATKPRRRILLFQHLFFDRFFKKPFGRLLHASTFSTGSRKYFIPNEIFKIKFSKNRRLLVSVNNHNMAHNVKIASRFCQFLNLFQNAPIIIILRTVFYYTTQNFYTIILHAYTQ